jgi:pimeloyl-ACP methyl ester carboxylesterase
MGDSFALRMPAGVTSSPALAAPHRCGKEDRPMARRRLAPRFPLVVRSLLHGDAAPDAATGPLPPVILLHGFGTSSAVTAPLARYLRRELGRPVIRVPLGGRLPIHLGDVRKSAARVLSEIEQRAAEAGFPYVDVVGHSLGGLVATYLLKALDRGRRVRRVITLGTPHRGTPAALFGALVLGVFSRAIWQMIPGSPLLRELSRLPVPSGSEVVAVASDADHLVPAVFARPQLMPRLRCAAVSGLGHVEFLTSPLAFRLVQAVLGV